MGGGGGGGGGAAGRADLCTPPPPSLHYPACCVLEGASIATGWVSILQGKTAYRFGKLCIGNDPTLKCTADLTTGI